MSKITEFYAKAMTDESVKKELVTILGVNKIDDASDEQLAEIGVLAKKLGFEISIEEAKTYLSGDNAELDEDDLDAVAGGKGETSKIELYKGEELRYQCHGSNGGPVK